MNQSKEMAFSPLRRVRSSDRVAEEIRRTIVDGRFEAGDLLPPERTLASRFAVTRNTVREALRKLEQLRLVKIRQGSGARVQDWLATAGIEFLAELIDTESDGHSSLIEDVYEARSVMGSALFARAIERLDVAGLPRISAAVDRFSDAAREGAPARELQRLESGVHGEILRASGNRAFMLFHNSLTHIYQRIAHLFEPVVGDPLWLAERYGAFVEAIECDDREQAKTIFLEVLSSAQDNR